MTNPFFIIEKVSYSFNSCTLSEKRDKILLLMNPQIVYLIEKAEGNKINSKNSLDFNRPFQDISGPDTSDIFASSKFDKKNKSNIKVVDSLEIKKNKLKQKKKIRNKVHLDHDEVFLSDSKNHVIPNEDNLPISLVRPNNTIKQKKKNRLKTESNTNSFVSSSSQLEEELLSIDKINQEIVLDRPVSVQELSEKLSIPVAEIITWLFMQGISVTINQVVDLSISIKVAKNYNFNIIDSSKTISNKSLQDVILDKNKAVKRAPIITIFGHVDHGKTTLLDKIRQTNLVNQEVGGITQAIAGYEVEYINNNQEEKLIFLDTPGHEAFKGMRNRGAQVTDVAILVVAADDGLKPQSIEAINHILEKKIPFIVVINKVDKIDIDIEKVKSELSEYGILGEEWGGQVPIIEISALTGKNIDILLSSLCILSELQDLKADPNQLAKGTILEAHLDKQKGPIANVLIQNGTVHIGDLIISDKTLGKVKVIVNNSHVKADNAGPSSVIEVWGFSSVPNAGSTFEVLRDEKIAKEVISNYIASNDSTVNLLNSRVTLDNYTNKQSITKQINVILKTDTQGSIEAIINAFSQIPQEKVQINILSGSSGEVADKDIDLALASNSLILGFNVNISSKIRSDIDQLKVVVQNFNVIYDLINYIKDHMLSLVSPEYNRIIIGNAIVQTVFSVNKGFVAGCLVNSGKLKKKSYIRVFRNQIIVYDGILNSLKRLKDDVDEISAINECGVMCLNYNLWEKADLIEAYELTEKAKTL